MAILSKFTRFLVVDDAVQSVCAQALVSPYTTLTLVFHLTRVA